LASDPTVLVFCFAMSSPFTSIYFPCLFGWPFSRYIRPNSHSQYSINMRSWRSTAYLNSNSKLEKSCFCRSSESSLCVQLAAGEKAALGVIQCSDPQTASHIAFHFTGALKCYFDVLKRKKRWEAWHQNEIPLLQIEQTLQAGEKIVLPLRRAEGIDSICNCYEL
jgi:hypothetical protein